MMNELVLIEPMTLQNMRENACGRSRSSVISAGTRGSRTSTILQAI